MTKTNTVIDVTGLIGRIRQLVRERYILERDAPLIAADLDEAAADLASIDDPARVAHFLPTRMQQVDGDRHLRPLHRPIGAATGLDGAEHEARWAADAVREAGGIRQVQLLVSVINYL